MNSMDYIRKTYGLTCKRGDRVRYSPPDSPARDGVIVGAQSGYLRIKLYSSISDRYTIRNYHPEDHLTYLGKGGEKISPKRLKDA